MNGSQFLCITIESGKDTTDPPMLVFDYKRDDAMIIDDMDENKATNLVVNVVVSQNPLVFEKKAKSGKGKGKEVPAV